jgi:NAD(P)-dependent dehydrogenase (short-subunit alcohol dehydrogenase family)
MSELDGRVALVTGANRGIGRAIAESLARHGVTVLIGARDLDRAVAVAGELTAHGFNVVPLQIDLVDHATVSAAAATILARFGHLDVLVNNAAIKLEHHPSPPSTASIDDVRDTLETNVIGTIRVIQTMLPLLQRSDRPRIVNLSSGLGSLSWATTAGSKYQARPLLSYNTSKAALNMVTVLFANEFRDSSLRINAVDPGPVNTPMTMGRATRQPDDGAASVIACLSLPNDGPTGGFFDEHGEVPW